METFVSVIIPVKNEGGILRRCLESLRGLDYPKDRLEIIIADGLSSDNTRDIARDYGVKVVTNQKQVVVSGRNCGFAESSGEIIAFTDADCVFDSGWIKNSIKYFNDVKVGGIGGVTLAPKESSGFEKAVDAVFYLADIFHVTSHRKSASISREVKDIPGCNAIYRREALKKVMPVDENLLTAEDAWMNYCIRKAGYKFLFAPDVVLWHHRRNSPKGFLRQMYRFAIGRLQAGKRSRELLNPFHKLLGISLIIIFAAGLIFYFAGAFALFLKSILIFLAASALFFWARTKSLSTAVNIPLVTVIFVFGWSAGFLRELFFPMKDVKGK